MPEDKALEGKTARYCTLGCKLNFSETAAFARGLAALGLREAAEGEKADICLVNTCAVTETAAAKCRQALHRIARENPGAFIVVTGCFAQLRPGEIAEMKGVALVLGSDEKALLPRYVAEAYAKERGETICRTARTKDIKSFAPSCSRGGRTRYFLKVQDGCNYYCTYCTIPMARGNSRNPSVRSLVAQARQAALEGGREIVLTGVNIGDFGRSTGERFTDLVRALEKVEGIERYRISSIEPDLLGDDLIEYCARESRKFMPHFHIPLQSGSDGVLRLMHRRYDTTLFRHKTELIKRLMPDAFIGIDIMTGCRGETPERFDESLEFVESLPVAKLHVFPYSERPGTAALGIDYAVGEKEKRRRTDILLALSEKKQKAFYESFAGTERSVLFEHGARAKDSAENLVHGFTDNYIRVTLRAGDRAAELDNTIRKVRLGGFSKDGKTLECVLAGQAAL